METITLSLCSSPTSASRAAPPMVSGMLGQQVDRPASTQIIQLNVGGTYFTTTRSTLCRVKNSFFAVLFSSRWDKAMDYDEQSRVFIDRSALAFPIILDYLRGMEVHAEDLSKKEMQHLQSDADYYGLTELACYLRNPHTAPRFHATRGCIELDEQDQLARFTPSSGQANGDGVSSPTIKWNNRVIANLPFPRPFAFEPFTEQTVQIVAGTQIMIGLAPNAVLFDDTLNYHRCGWYMFVGNGSIYSQDEPAGAGTLYRRGGTVEPGSTISVRLYADGSISFAVNGVDGGRAYCNVVRGDVYLTVMMCGPIGSVRLVY